MSNAIKTLQGFRTKSSYQDSAFQKLYEKLLLSKDPNEFSDEEKIALLKWAIFFFNQEFEDVKKLGYRIIVRYSNLFEEYIPLYDTALNAGFIPVAKFIEDKYLNKKQVSNRFFNCFLSSYKENFRSGDIYLSDGQMDLVNFSKAEHLDSLIVAPTSYGKSEMMISKVVDNPNKKICIIVPSKALLAQTKKRLLANEDIAKNFRRIITHPEMYRAEDTKFIAVLTQERLLRLVQQTPEFKLDLLMVDEAHNIMAKGSRAELLLQVILILKNRNSNTRLHFFTPFIASHTSVETKYSDYVVKAKRSKEFIKIEKYFIYDAKGKRNLTLYDQFIDRHLKVETLDLDSFGFINKFKAGKNILYANKPRDVENIAQKISTWCPTIDFSSDENASLQEAHLAISEYLHKDYALLKCLKRGVVYHHGKVPEIIRLYVERIFSEDKKFQFIATTSTLLEGVNIPAEKIFLLSVDKGRGHLKKSDFRNLTGRVCRFNEAFSKKTGNLKMLEPEIYVLKGKYSTDDFNPYTFYESRAKLTLNDKDVIENILLKEIVTEEDKRKELLALEYLENIEQGTLTLPENIDIRQAETSIGAACFKNNVHEFDIHEFEYHMTDNYEEIKDNPKIDNASDLIKALTVIFIEVIASEENDRRKDHFELARLTNEQAQKFYSYFLEWKMKGSSYSQMIGSYLWYWKKREEQGDPIIYIGSAWGEIKREDHEFLDAYVDISEKTPAQRVNLAIIKIKDEYDFVEYKLLKYIDILNDLDLLDASFYDRIRYGSSDPKTICMLKNGISLELAKLLLDEKYSQYIMFDMTRDMVSIKAEALAIMEEERENRILVFELSFHI